MLLLAGTRVMIRGVNWIFFEKALLVAGVDLFIGRGKRLRLRGHSHLVKVDQVLL